MQASYDRMREKRSLAFRLAYTAGFESMTLGITKWLVDDRVELFRGSDSRVASFVLWHMVEETEHKRVAFDVYQAACPGYFMRAFGVFAGSLHVIACTRKGYIAMLRQDGLWWNWRSRLRLWKRSLQFLRAATPLLLRSALPGHDPSKEEDPRWVRQWIAAFAAHSSAPEVPLLDTSSLDMPPPFAQRLAE